jgi:4-amino-4-deoxy-L-arabinose transferase-like glycosyltransferase
LVGDEAYYWLWSRHPDICYLDKGPMIAWFIWLGTALFGQTVFGVRFFAVILAGGTGLAILLLARRLFADRAAFWAVALASIVPLFAVGASIMTVDTVYIFFWGWAAVVFWHAKDTTRLGPWFLTGLLVGLGLLAKYTAALELISFVGFCLTDRTSRRHFRRLTFWTMLGTALVFLLPAIVWNYQHHWPTSDWLLQRGSLDRGFALHPGSALGFLGGQAGVISPLIFIGLIFLLFRPSLLHAPQPATAYVLSLFLPLFGFYFLLSFHYAGPPNWTAAAYIGGLVLLTGKWPALEQRYAWMRPLAVVAIALAFLETAILAETRWLHLSHRVDPLDRARGSRNLAASVAQWQKRSGAQFIIAGDYMTAALLSFYLPGQPEVYVPATTRPLNQLELWADYEQKYPGASALLVDKRSHQAQSIRQTFARIEPLTVVEVTDRERQIGRYHLFLATHH